MSFWNRSEPCERVLKTGQVAWGWVLRAGLRLLHELLEQVCALCMSLGSGLCLADDLLLLIVGMQWTLADLHGRSDISCPRHSLIAEIAVLPCGAARFPCQLCLNWKLGMITIWNSFLALPFDDEWQLETPGAIWASGWMDGSSFGNDLFLRSSPWRKKIAGIVGEVWVTK